MLESLACGTPCLASDLPEMREAIPTGAEGVLAARTAQAFARGLATILSGHAVPPRSVRTWSDVGRDVLSYFEERCGCRALAR